MSADQKESWVPRLSDITPRLVLRWATVVFVIAVYALTIITAVLAIVGAFS